MSASPGRVLVVDDDADVLVAAQLLLKRHFATVETVSDPNRLPELTKAGFDAILLDMNFALGANTGAEGLKWLETILASDPEAAVILMTAYGDVATAVDAIKAGATDFVLKPWQNEKLVATVSAAVRLHQSRDEVARLRTRQRELITAASDRRTPIIGRSSAMREILDVVRRAAPTEANVLLLGENGTGKELIAREIHARSNRADEVFMSVDLGAVPESLFESELFGHRKGAFTDAREDRAGRFQAASGGTLFLDEIGNLPLHLQGKLLSALEQRAVVPLGSSDAIPIDVRLISATNQPLAEMCRDNRFREDLLYRVNTVEIRIPPLRERTEDIQELVDHFITMYAKKYGLPRKGISSGALNLLRSHPWPGNIRELQHAIERALIMSDKPTLTSKGFFFSRETNKTAGALELDDYSLENVEEQVIRTVLAKHSGNVSKAARELGITRTSLYRRMNKYGL